MGISDEFASKSIKHAVDLIRFSESLRGDILDILRDLSTDLAEKMKSTDLAGTVISAVQAKRLDNLKLQVIETIETSYKATASVSKDAVVEVAALEQTEVVSALNEVLHVELAQPTLTGPMLKEIATDSIVHGATQAEWWTKQANDLARRFTQQIRLGMLSGETNKQLVERIRGTATGKTAKGKAVFKGGIMDVSEREAFTLVRTSVQTVANNVRVQTYLNNKDIIKGVQALATLDMRTSDICKARSGKVWPIDSVADASTLVNTPPSPTSPANIKPKKKKTTKKKPPLPKIVGDRPIDSSMEKIRVETGKDGLERSFMVGKDGKISPSVKGKAGEVEMKHPKLHEPGADLEGFHTHPPDKPFPPSMGDIASLTAPGGGMRGLRTNTIIEPDGSLWRIGIVDGSMDGRKKLKKRSEDLFQAEKSKVVDLVVAGKIKPGSKEVFQLLDVDGQKRILATLKKEGLLEVKFTPASSSPLRKKKTTKKKTTKKKTTKKKVIKKTTKKKVIKKTKTKKKAKLSKPTTSKPSPTTRKKKFVEKAPPPLPPGGLLQGGTQKNGVFVNTSEWKKGLSSGERSAIRRYSDKSYLFIRAADRGRSTTRDGSPVKAKHRKDAITIDSALARAVGFKSTAYRGLNVPIDKAESLVKSIEKNGGYEFDAVTSASRSRIATLKFGTALQFVIKSRTGVSVENFARYKDEQEVLFRKGSKFKLNKVDRKIDSGKKRIVVHLTEL